MTAGQVPDQPGIHGAEQHLARLGPGPKAGMFVKQPARLWSGEIGGQRQAGFSTKPVLTGLSAQGLHQPVGAGVLPDDGVGDGPTGVGVPQHSRLALVGDADGGQV